MTTRVARLPGFFVLRIRRMAEKKNRLRARTIRGAERPPLVNYIIRDQRVAGALVRNFVPGAPFGVSPAVACSTKGP